MGTGRFLLQGTVCNTRGRFTCVIDGKTAILATLYNVGEYGEHGINSTPESNEFGDYAKEKYYHVKELLK